MLRLPRTAGAAARLVLLVRALPRLRPLVPVAVPLPRLVRVPGDGVLLHGALGPSALLVDPRRGVLTGVVGWRLRLDERADELAGLDPAARAALG